VPHPLAFARALTGEGGSDQAARSSYVDFFRTEGSEDQMLADDAQGLRNLYLASGLPPDDVDAYLEVFSDRAALRGGLNWYRAVDLTLVADLNPITVPTLFIWSTDDPALGRHGAEATAEYVDGPYRFEVLEGVSHWIAEEAPEQLARLVIEHLAGPDA
jgi:pimeloyl-ACP methyl ester carboxylesterase